MAYFVPLTTRPYLFLKRFKLLHTSMTLNIPIKHTISQVSKPDEFYEIKKTDCVAWFDFINVNALCVKDFGLLVLCSLQRATYIVGPASFFSCSSQVYSFKKKIILGRFCHYTLHLQKSPPRRIRGLNKNFSYVFNVKSHKMNKRIKPTPNYYNSSFKLINPQLRNRRYVKNLIFPKI